MRISVGLALLTVGSALVLGGCGGSDSTDGALVVSAASSLQDPFTAYAKEDFPAAKQSFAGSDDLAAQIRQGFNPDVYASADISLPEQLHKAGLVSKPVVFAANQLVLAVPADSKIISIGDLVKPGLKIVTGDASVPVGAYTQEVLNRLPSGERAPIEANIRSKEPEVGSVIGKLEQGAADAGFVYATDVLSSSDLKAVELPKELQPVVSYGVAIPSKAKNPDGAKQFIDGLLHGDGAAALKRAGFLPPPK